MFYDTTAIDMGNHDFIYVAIKPLANNPNGLFTQVVVPLKGGNAPLPPVINPIANSAPNTVVPGISKRIPAINSRIPVPILPHGSIPNFEKI